MSMSTAKLVMWLHWQLMWLLFLLSTSQPLADQPPVPPILNTPTDKSEQITAKKEDINTVFVCKIESLMSRKPLICICVCIYEVQLTRWSGSRTHTQVWFSPPSPAWCTPRWWGPPGWEEEADPHCAPWRSLWLCWSLDGWGSWKDIKKNHN